MRSCVHVCVRLAVCLRLGRLLPVCVYVRVHMVLMVCVCVCLCVCVCVYE